MSVSKRKNKWYCRFQINGERHHYLCEGAMSKQQAEQIEASLKFKIMQQQNGVILKESKDIKLKTLLDDFIQYSLINKKSHQTDVYAVKILKNYFKETYANKLTLKDLEKFKQYLLVERKVSNATFNRYRALLSKTYNIGIANKLLKENPIHALKQMKEQNFKIRFLTKAEENNLLNVTDKYFPYLSDLIICALQTGMRRGEIFNLKWSNIDFEFNYIELLETKSGKSRKIPLSDKLKDILNKQQHISEYVFINKETKAPYTDIKHSFQTALNKAHIENFRFHDLRHTVATRLIEKGIDVVVVKEILGHSDIQTTMRYAHAVPKRKIEAISVLNSYN